MSEPSELDKRMYEDIREIKQKLEKLVDRHHATDKAVAVIQNKMSIIGAVAGLVGAAFWGIVQKVFF